MDVTPGLSHGLSMGLTPPPDGVDGLGAGDVLAGEPVSVATCAVVETRTDRTVPGDPPLTLTRSYRSNDGADPAFPGHLGPKWRLPWDETLEVTDDAVLYRKADGQTLAFPVPEADGGEVAVQGNPAFRLGLAEGVHIVRAADGTRRRFGAAIGGRLHLTAIADRLGNTLTLARSPADGLVTGARRDDGVRLIPELVDAPDGGRRLGAIVLHAPGEKPATLVTYGYHDGAAGTGPAGMLANVRGAPGANFDYAYDAAGRMLRWQDLGGTWFAHRYDDNGRRVEGAGAEGRWSDRFVHHPEAGETVHHDAEGGTTRYRHDARGLAYATVDPHGHTWTTEWDDARNKVAEVDPLGHRTEYVHDDWGRVTAVTGPDGAVTAYAWGDDGRLLTVTDPDGNVFERQYDEAGRLTRIQAPDGTGVTYSHDDRGRVIAETDDLGAATGFDYDGAGRLRAVVDPLGHRDTVVLDAFGRVRRHTDPLGNTTAYAYAAHGALARADLPDGTVIRRRYDAEGNLAAHTDGEGNTSHVATGPWDLPRAITDPVGNTTHLEHDRLGRRTAVVNAAGERWTYAFDAAGNLVAETAFDGRRTEYDRDAAGRVVARRELAANGFTGETTRYALDAAGRVVRETAPDGGETTYAYDARGLVVEAAGPGGTVTFARDALGRVVEETQTTPDGVARTVTTAYDAAGRPVHHGRPHGQALSAAYDARGRATALQVHDGESARAPLYRRHDAKGREVVRASPLGFTRTRTWDGLDRPVAERAGRNLDGPGGVPVGSFGAPPAPEVPDLSAPAPPLPGADARLTPEVVRDYAWDRAFNPTRIRDARWGATALTYDPNGQVARAADADGETRYAYDARLNPVGRRASPGGNVVALYGPGGRVQQFGDVQYRYDARGRVVEKRRARNGFRPRIWRFQWDPDDRLVALTEPDGTVWRYDYDPFGRRLRKLSAKGGVAFVWDGDALAQEIPLEPDGTERVAEAVLWAWEADGTTPVARLAGGELCYAVTDHLGTPRELLAEDGRLAWAGRVTLWGAVAERVSVTCDCPLRLPGQRADPESGLHYNRFRYYDPDTGAYLSPDPIGLAGGLRPWSYVHNPAAWIDPLGLAGCGKDPEDSMSSGSDELSFSDDTLRKEHERLRKKHGKGGVKQTETGRIRYYSKIIPASDAGEMAGRRKAREWNPRRGHQRDCPLRLPGQRASPA
jgi:RHS repeat-associated protein